MTVRRRHVFQVVVLAAVFGAGWATAKARSSPSSLRADRAAVGTGVSADAPTCVDRHAMEANANLVEQVGDFRRRFERAHEEARAAAVAVEASRKVSPSHVVPTRDEWARMARDGTIRMRSPCAIWHDTGTYSLLSARGEEREGAAAGGGLRTGVAGLSEAAELEALGEAYERALSKTWAAMRSACEANAAYRKSLAEAATDVRSPQLNIASCTSVALDMQDAGARRAVAYVAQLRAAGAGIERATSEEQRIGFVLSTATATLYDEVARTLGRERATRILDNGVGCFDESVYDVHDPPAEETVVDPASPPEEAAVD